MIVLSGFIIEVPLIEFSFTEKMNSDELHPPEMYEAHWGSCSHRLSRKFSLEIKVSLFTPLVRDVLNNLENDHLNVFRPDDREAFEACLDADGVEVVNKRADLPVNIRDWLPVGCQWIGFDDLENTRKDALACYEHNAPKILFPKGDRTPIGPSAFVGEIRLMDRCFPKDNDPENTDAFKFVVAHELVHVFDMMRFLVPAVMNWRRFSQIVLDFESSREDAATQFMNKAAFLDDYGNDNERAMVAEFWPSFADKWFNACNRVYRSKK